MTDLIPDTYLYLMQEPSDHPARKYLGRKIVSAEILDNELRLAFSDGSVIQVGDGGQNCCERRYMTTDDDVSDLVGCYLFSIGVKDGPDLEDDGDCHEIRFLEIGTNQGCITLVNHNEHNGYYGGFNLAIVDV